MFGPVCNWKLSDSPEVINTFSSRHNLLRCVFVHNEQEIWTSGEYYEITSFNRVAKPTRTIQTLSGEWPSDITVTNNGELIYCDWKLCTVNKIVNNETEVFIRLHGWTPTNLFATAYGDLLVQMTTVNLRLFDIQTIKNAKRFNMMKKVCLCIREVQKLNLSMRTET